jgi:hypothetical protein
VANKLYDHLTCRSPFPIVSARSLVLSGSPGSEQSQNVRNSCNPGQHRRSREYRASKVHVCARGLDGRDNGKALVHSCLCVTLQLSSTHKEVVRFQTRERSDLIGHLRNGDDYETAASEAVLDEQAKSCETPEHGEHAWLYRRFWGHSIRQRDASLDSPR